MRHACLHVEQLTEELTLKMAVGESCMTTVKEEEQKLSNLLLMRVSGCHMYIHNASKPKIFECIIVLWLVPLGAVTSRLTTSACAIF